MTKERGLILYLYAPRGSPRPRVAIMFFCISLVPPAIITPMVSRYMCLMPPSSAGISHPRPVHYAWKWILQTYEDPLHPAPIHPGNLPGHVLIILSAVSVTADSPDDDGQGSGGNGQGSDSDKGAR